MDLIAEAKQRHLRYQTRRHFLRRCSTGLGGLALGWMLGCDASRPSGGPDEQPGTTRLGHFAPRARSVIFLHMEGGPSQLELFDYKPELARLHRQTCPPSILEGRRFAFVQEGAYMLGPDATFARHGESGAWVSDHLPEFASVADEVTFLKAVHTDEFNHAPAQLMLHCGSRTAGRPGMGAWVTYGLGSENDNLPGYVVLVSGLAQPSAGKSLWASGFLPTSYQGVSCRSTGAPILYMDNPEGVDRTMRRHALDAIERLNRKTYEEARDPETLARIAQYELAFRMQTAAPEAFDITQESEAVHALYGTAPGERSFANNCLLARRLVERGVRFVQLFHDGWDSHGNSAYQSIDYGFRQRCAEIDRPMKALLIDLKQRGLLDETLVVWGGEFGRTPMQENRNGRVGRYLGRDHHAEAFTMWMAGGGIRQGFTYGETDEIGLEPVSGRVHIHDLQATILHQLGLDHERLTYLFQGRDYRLTDVGGRVVHEILA